MFYTNTNTVVDQSSGIKNKPTGREPLHRSTILARVHRQSATVTKAPVVTHDSWRERSSPRLSFLTSAAGQQKLPSKVTKKSRKSQFTYSYSFHSSWTTWSPPDCFAFRWNFDQFPCQVLVYHRSHRGCRRCCCCYSSFAQLKPQQKAVSWLWARAIFIPRPRELPSGGLWNSTQSGKWSSSRSEQNVSFCQATVGMVLAVTHPRRAQLDLQTGVVIASVYDRFGMN